jgi:hypothetical protein
MNKADFYKCAEGSFFSKYSAIISHLFYDDDIGKCNKDDIPLICSFFISVFIYYQNKNSPLMNILKNQKNYQLYHLYMI